MLGCVYAHSVLEVGMHDLDNFFQISYLRIENLPYVCLKKLFNSSNFLYTPIIAEEIILSFFYYRFCLEERRKTKSIKSNFNFYNPSLKQ